MPTIVYKEEGNLQSGAVFGVKKPFRWTSFDVVNKIKWCLKKSYGKIKVGHAGTLDPLATGVVVICVGRATKEIDRYMGEEKEYVAEVTFGKTTPSYDLETDFNGIYDYSHVDESVLRRVLPQFVGTIEQIPPAYSAVRVDGARAYEKARAGGEVEMKSRRVTVRDIEVMETNFPMVKLRINCGKGTYIRSLANDIGKACGSGAYLSALERTRVGEFEVGDCFQVEEIVGVLQQMNRIND